MLMAKYVDIILLLHEYKSIVNYKDERYNRKILIGVD